jgi:hypothetical protein
MHHFKSVYLFNFFTFFHFFWEFFYMKFFYLSVFISSSISSIALGICNAQFPTNDGFYYTKANGCGSSTKVPQTINWTHITNACDMHDRCYMTLGMPKQRCDDNFVTDIRDICERAAENVNPLRKMIMFVECQTMLAEIYHLAVVVAGHGAYEDSQKNQRIFTQCIQHSLNNNLISPYCRRAMWNGAYVFGYLSTGNGTNGPICTNENHPIEIDFRRRADGSICAEHRIFVDNETKTFCLDYLTEPDYVLERRYYP